MAEKNSNALHDQESELKNDSAPKLGPVCPSCGKEKLMSDEDAGETVCTNCGTVIPEKIIYTGPERRMYDTEQRLKRQRTGLPADLLLHDKGLSTSIGFGREGKLLTDLDRYKLRKWQIRTRFQYAYERNLALALHEITGMGSRLNIIKSILDTSSLIYRKALKKGLVKGRSIQAVAAASIYAACRLTGTPKDLKEIAEVSGISDKKAITRVYRLLINEGIVENVKLPAYKEFALKYSNKLNMSGRTQGIIIKILDAAKEGGFTEGKSPQGLAGAATYIGGVLGNESYTQMEIAEKSKVTEVTIRNRYKEMMKRLFIEVPLKAT